MAPRKSTSKKPSVAPRKSTPRKPTPADSPRRPGRQTHSAEELEERIEFVARLVGKDLLKSDLKRKILEKWRVSTRTAEEYISRARELLIQWSGQSKEEHFVEAVAFYKSVLQSSESTLSERMRARERLDALYALQPPQEHRLGQSSQAGPVQIIETVVRTREEAAALLKQLPPS